MKKIILCLNFILIAVWGFGQTLKPVKVDSLVTVSLPANFTKKDTLDQRIFSGTGALGYMVVIRSKNAINNKALNKERDLNKVLKAYISSVQKQSVNGSIMNPRDTIIGALKAKVFTLRIDNSGSTGESPELRNFILIYTQDAFYTFEYYYPEQRAGLAAAELKEFSGSIRLAPSLKRNDQYLSNAKGLSPLAKTGIYGGGAVLLIIILISIIRKKKKQEAEI